MLTPTDYPDGHMIQLKLIKVLKSRTTELDSSVPSVEGEARG